MTLLFRYWLDLCLLRAAPQDGPASTFILGLALACYGLVSLVVLVGSYDVPVGATLALLDLVLLVVFVTALLYLLGKTARIRQTLAALAGAGALLGLAALPLVLLQAPAAGNGTQGPVFSLVWIVLLVWNVVVSANIMRHALSSSFAMGLAVSILYLLVSTQIVLGMIPDEIGP